MWQFSFIFFFYWSSFYKKIYFGLSIHWTEFREFHFTTILPDIFHFFFYDVLKMSKASWNSWNIQRSIKTFKRHLKNISLVFLYFKIRRWSNFCFLIRKSATKIVSVVGMLSYKFLSRIFRLKWKWHIDM